MGRARRSPGLQQAVSSDPVQLLLGVSGCVGLSARPEDRPRAAGASAVRQLCGRQVRDPEPARLHRSLGGRCAGPLPGAWDFAGHLGAPGSLLGHGLSVQASLLVMTLE